ncbi:MAG: hypothetical protein IPG89_07970 [Bacteroidetes bacterium]|nr:hypothetical protein [Bacteroidota bacterium]
MRKYVTSKPINILELIGFIIIGLIITSCSNSNMESSPAEQTETKPDGAIYEKSNDFKPGITEFYNANKTEFDNLASRIDKMLAIANDSLQFKSGLSKMNLKAINLDFKQATKNTSLFIIEGMKDTASFTYKPLFSVSDFTDDCYMLSKFGLDYMVANIPSQNHYRQFFYEGLDDYKLKPYLITLDRITESEFKYYGDSFKSGSLAFKVCVFETKTEQLLSSFVCNIENENEIFYYKGDNIPEKITQDLKQQIPRLIYAELFKRFTINGNGTNLYIDFINRY